MFAVRPVQTKTIGTVRTPVRVGPIADLAIDVGHYLAPLPDPLGVTVELITGDGTPVVAKVLLENGKPLLLFARCPDVALLYESLAVRNLALLDLPFARVLRQGTCRICGCTMEHACPCGCWWTDPTETLCRQHDRHQPSHL